MQFQLAHGFFRLVWDEESLFYQAMAFTGLASVLRLLLLLGLTLCVFHHGRSFAKLRQESSSSVLERSGRGAREKFKAYLDIKLNQAEKNLLSKISTAGERRQWSAVRSAFASYTGDAVPIYTAGLHAAVRCRDVHGRRKDIWTGSAEMRIHERAYVHASPENFWQAQRLC